MVDANRYDSQRKPKNKPRANAENNEYGFIKMRYKLPKANKSKLITRVISTENNAPNDLHLNEVHFAANVAGFAQLLKNSNYRGNWNYDQTIASAQRYKGEDIYGYRTEFIQLVRKAKIAKAM